ncbi:hypothetical protein HY229_06340 [Candidatus Acetothermia bacterium]|nr:hypothetical protein [Candidatus Acetothermia bacterium]MBI3643700.1 hypothetical protein [Candidatus Acetothermia bacterium]
MKISLFIFSGLFLLGSVATFGNSASIDKSADTIMQQIYAAEGGTRSAVLMLISMVAFVGGAILREIGKSNMNK